jgi:hypothetical protein
MKMFSKISFVSVCLSIVANVQACETEKKRFDKNSIIFGVMGVPAFVYGRRLCNDGKEWLVAINEMKKLDQSCYIQEEYRVAKYTMFMGRSFKVIGAGLVLAPVLMHYQLLRDQVSKWWNYERD